MMLMQGSQAASSGLSSMGAQRQTGAQQQQQMSMNPLMMMRLMQMRQQQPTSPVAPVASPSPSPAPYAGSAPTASEMGVMPAFGGATNAAPAGTAADMGVMPAFGGATNAGAAGGSGAAAGGSGAGAGAGAFAIPAAAAVGIMAGKTLESQYPDTWLGRGLLSGLGPSIPQVMADPKLGLTTALGLPFLNGWIRNDKAANAKPEWFQMFGAG